MQDVSENSKTLKKQGWLVGWIFGTPCMYAKYRFGRNVLDACNVDLHLDKKSTLQDRFFFTFSHTHVEYSESIVVWHVLMPFLLVLWLIFYQIEFFSCDCVHHYLPFFQNHFHAVLSGP